MSEQLTRRDFLRFSSLALASMAISGCRVRESEQGIVESRETVELPYLRFINNWIYPVNIESSHLFSLADEFGLPIRYRKSVDIELTNDTQAYVTPHEIQSHTVILSSEEIPDRVLVSCGRYVEEVKRITGQEPRTVQDELFLSTALSESVFNGLADLAGMRGKVSLNEADRIIDSYVDQLLGTPLQDQSLIFAWVLLTEGKPAEGHAQGIDLQAKAF